MGVTKVRGILHVHQGSLSLGISSRRLCRKWSPGASPPLSGGLQPPRSCNLAVIIFWFVNAHDVHPDVSYWIWQSSTFYGTLVTVVIFHLLFFCITLNSPTLTYFYTSKPSTLDTHTYLRTCAIIIYLSGLYALNVHVESFVTAGNETYLGYLLQTAHMFLMKLTWFIIPDFLCSHHCFFL